MSNLIPASAIRFAGRLQFRYPFLRRPINYIAQKLTSRGPGTIRHGVGQGLKFNAQGCNPGFLYGTSEPLEQQLIADLLSQGDVFYEIGANAGFYCVIGARRVGDSGVVYGFEPTPGLAARIRENAILNDFKNIEVIESAVGATTGLIEFGVSGDLSVENSINAAKRGGNILTVPCTTIDVFAQNHRPPTLILMDVEGAELDVLVGAMETIRSYLPIIMVEVHWLGDRFIDFYENQLKPLGYSAATYEGSPMPIGSIRFHCLLRAANSDKQHLIG